MSNTLIYIECKETDHLMIFTSLCESTRNAIDESLNLLTKDYDVENFAFSRVVDGHLP